MAMIDKNKLALIEKEFKDHPRGLKLSSFIWYIQTILNFDMEDQYELIEGLIKLFKDIDINGDGDLQWSEFNQYIIDEVMAQPPILELIDQSTVYMI